MGLSGPLLHILDMADRDHRDWGSRNLNKRRYSSFPFRHLGCRLIRSGFGDLAAGGMAMALRRSVCGARTKQITEARVGEVLHLELTKIGLFALRGPDDLTKAGNRVLAILHKYVEDLDRIECTDATLAYVHLLYPRHLPYSRLSHIGIANDTVLIEVLAQRRGEGVHGDIVVGAVEYPMLDALGINEPTRRPNRTYFVKDRLN
jgi:hypothetical protein